MRATRWRVATSEGDAFDADRVIMATESHATARLVRYLDPSLATLLEEIPYASAATVSLGYRRADVPHPLDGFGFVVPRTEGRALLAGTFSSVKYPGRAPEGHVLIRALPGRHAQRGRAGARTTTRWSRARAMSYAPRSASPPRRCSRACTAGPRRCRSTGSVTSRGSRRSNAGSPALPGLSLAGAAYRGVGIADCVRSGEAAAEAALAR